MKGKRLLVTGGAGFIGSNFIIYMLKQYPDIRIVNLDKLTYAGKLENLQEVAADPRYSFVRGDIANLELVMHVTRDVDAIVNFAAESHVDRSIEDPLVFVQTNVTGAQVLLEAARQHKIERYLQVSTDEVYGSLGPTGYFTEETPLAPNSPYSASKTAADMLVRAAYETFGLPALITRCSNNYGPRQYPEKLIPYFIKKLLADEQVPIYGDGLNVRDWLHVEDHCRAIDLVLHKGAVGSVYNIGGNNEWTNIEITRLILKELGKPESLIKYVQDRLGHDRRYAIDASKIKRELGWEPKWRFKDGIKETVKWYVEKFTDLK